MLLWERENGMLTIKQVYKELLIDEREKRGTSIGFLAVSGQWQTAASWIGKDRLPLLRLCRRREHPEKGKGNAMDSQ